MDSKQRPKILCVDDEPSVVEGLALHLRRRYDVVMATSGAEGLERLQQHAIAVVMSDMRMPHMNGAEFLSQVKERAPDTVRLLLTGQADLESTISAVNQGQIFRFLSKPCPPPALMEAIAAAVEQYRLVTSERVLLEQTLHGSIKTLTDVLALTNPASFGRATRIKQHVSELAEKLEMRDRWQVEVAAMLSQLGSITLPPETAEKVYYGQELSEHEQKMVERLPSVVEQLLGHIPRLEVVRGILSSYPRPYRAKTTPESDPQKALIDRGAQLLKVAVDFDVLEAQGSTLALAIDTMRGRTTQYDPAVIAALDGIRGGEHVRDEVRELPISALQKGMVFADDVKLTNGTLLAARGYEVTTSFVERARNFRTGTVKEPVRVLLRAPAKSA